MTDMSEFGASAEPKSGGETLKARFQALVEAQSTPVEHPEIEDEIVRFGEVSIQPVGPVLFDGLRFLRRQFINYRLPGEPFYVADTIAVTVGGTSIYEITYDDMSKDFNGVQAGGADIYDGPSDTQEGYERAAQTLVDWIESVEGGLIPKDTTPLPSSYLV